MRPLNPVERLDALVGPDGERRPTPPAAGIREEFQIAIPSALRWGKTTAFRKLFKKAFAAEIHEAMEGRR